jgi:hypothetical protein
MGQGRDSLDRRHKSKTTFRYRFDVTRRLGVVAQRLPEFSESRAKTLVKVDEGVGRPQPAADLFAGDHFSGTVQQHEKKLRRLLLQPHAQTLLPQLPCCGVQFKDAETEDSRRLCRFLHGDFLEGFKV